MPQPRLPALRPFPNERQPRARRVGPLPAGNRDGTGPFLPLTLRGGSSAGPNSARPRRHPAGFKDDVRQTCVLCFGIQTGTRTRPSGSDHPRRARGRGRRAQISFQETQRGGFTNLYLDAVTPLDDEEQLRGEGTGVADADEIAWKSAVDAAPWLLGLRAGARRTAQELSELLQPFKELVADDIRDGEGGPQPKNPIEVKPDANRRGEREAEAPRTVAYTVPPRDVAQPG